MRTFLFLSVLFSMFIFVIVAAYKPSMIEKEYNRIKEPIEKHFAEKQEVIWRDAKNKEWQTWVNQMHVPDDCATRQTALQEVECKNQRQLQVNAFERAWANKIAQGWKPQGLD